MLRTPMAHCAGQARLERPAARSFLNTLTALLAALPAALEKTRQSHLDQEVWQRLDTRLLADLGLEHQARLLA